MALGPDHASRNRAELASQAEQIIDAAIARSNQTRVTIAASKLPIDGHIWDEFLAPKYRAAGWKVARWTDDQRECFLDLQA